MAPPSLNPVPWYSPEARKRGDVPARSSRAKAAFPWGPWLGSSVLVVASAAAGGGLVGWAEGQIAPAILGGTLVVLSLLCTFVQFWAAFNFFSGDKDLSLWALASNFVHGHPLREEPRAGIHAPEAALQQFLHQVRAYAVEKSFQRAKASAPSLSAPALPGAAGTDPGALLRRRWNEVLDTMNEFEIYLAGDPQAIVARLVSTQPMNVMDVSQVFREVAESFDTTWRRKGINIESAIVTPLKANTNEPLLRRLLVGPWRACVFLARRGNSVLFSAKSEAGAITARWEVDGLAIPDEALALVSNQELTVNERIEQGMLATDPQNSSSLHALISLVTWIDLTRASDTSIRLGHTTDGFVIEMKLK